MNWKVILSSNGDYNFWRCQYFSYNACIFFYIDGYNQVLQTKFLTMSALGKYNKVRIRNNGTIVGNNTSSEEGRSVTVGVLTISDRCSRGIKQDLSGPNLKNILKDHRGFRSDVKTSKLVPDEANLIKDTLVEWSDVLGLDLIVTTGGTGFGPRDVTPEATAEVIDREAPGFSTAIIVSSLSVTKDAMVTRLKSGLRGSTLIINLPGSRKAADECLRVVLPAIPHAMECLKDDPRICECAVKDDEKQKLAQKLKDSPKIVLADSLVAPSIPGAQQEPSVNNQHAVHHAHHSAHHSALELGEGQLTEEDLDLEEIDIESLLSNTNIASEDSGIVMNNVRGISSKDSIAENDFPALPIDEAFGLVLEKTQVLGLEEVYLPESFGRTLAENVEDRDGSSELVAKVSGFAFTGSILQGEIRAVNSSSTLRNGDCEKVVEGAVLPPGLDTVVPAEHTKDIDGNKIEVLRNTRRGEGTGTRNGVILSKGTKLGPSEIGKLTLAGVTRVDVYKKPNVALLSIGSKEEEQINHVTMQLSLQQHSVTPIDIGIVSSSPSVFSNALTEAYSKANVIICASKSLKVRDEVLSLVCKRFNATIHFGNVEMKPWSSSYFATTSSTADQKIFFILPESNISSILSTIFVIPALRKLSGVEEPGHTILKAQVPCDIELKDLPEYQQCQISWLPGNSLPVIESIQDKVLLSSSPVVSDLQGLLQLPACSEKCSKIKKDDLVDVLLINRI